MHHTVGPVEEKIFGNHEKDTLYHNSGSRGEGFYRVGKINRETVGNKSSCETDNDIIAMGNYDFMFQFLPNLWIFLFPRPFSQRIDAVLLKKWPFCYVDKVEH